MVSHSLGSWDSPVAPTYIPICPRRFVGWGVGGGRGPEVKFKYSHNSSFSDMPNMMRVVEALHHKHNLRRRACRGADWLRDQALGQDDEEGVRREAAKILLGGSGGGGGQSGG